MECVTCLPDGTSARFFFSTLHSKLNVHSFLKDFFFKAEIAFEPGEERTQLNKGHRGLCDDNRKSSRTKRERRWRMCARAGSGNQEGGRQGPGSEEGKGALEATVIPRDGTDRQRAGCRKQLLTFGKLHVTAAAPTDCSVPSRMLSFHPSQNALSTTSPCECPHYSSKLPSFSIQLVRIGHFRILREKEIWISSPKHDSLSPISVKKIQKGFWRTSKFLLLFEGKTKIEGIPSFI